MSKKYKSMLIFMIAVTMLQIGSLSAGAARHFNVTMRSDWMPSYDLKDTMIVQGVLTIDQQIRTGDEIGVYFQGTLCGAEKILNKDGSYSLYIFDYSAVNNGPHAGDPLDIKLWDDQRKVEVTSGIQVTILDSAVKNAAGRLIWKLNMPDTAWHVNVSYDLQVSVALVEPSEIYADQTQVITVTGKNFTAGAKVKIGSTELTPVSFINTTTLKATIPASLLPVGTYDLTVTVGDNSRTLSNGFKVLPSSSSVTRVDPNEICVDRAQEITITGNGFAAGAKVKIGSTELTPVTFTNTTTLKATVPAQFLSVGIYDLAVIMGSTRVTLASGFRVLSATPRITTLSPNSRMNDQMVPVLIIGSNLFSGSTAKIGNVPLRITGYSDDVIIYAEIPAGIEAGTYSVTVKSPAGSEGVLPSGYKVLPAPIWVTQVAPNVSYSNQNQEITVTGKNFTAGAKVKIGSTELTQVSFITTTTLKATVPVGFLPVGTYDLVVGVGETTAALTNGFTIQPGQEEKMSLARGLNLVGYPVPAPTSYFSYDFLTKYFTPQSLDSIWHYNSQSGQWEVTSWNNQGFPAGDKFAIKNGEGYLVYAKIKNDLVFPGVSPIFETNLYQGTNLVSFSPPSASFTSYDLVQGMVNGQAEIVAIQRYEKTSGRWYITFCQSGKATGDKFPINKDESYLVYMKKNRLAWIP